MGADDSSNPLSGPIAPDWRQLESLLGLGIDWIWELDQDFKLCRVKSSRVMDNDPLAIDTALGKSFWRLDFQSDAGIDWQTLRQLLANRQPLRDVSLCHQISDHEAQFIRLNGAPVTQADSPVTYRGIAQLDKARMEQVDLQRRFSAMVDASPDLIFLSDVETQKLVYVNEAVCEISGFSRAELYQMCGHHLTGRSQDYGKHILELATKFGNEGVFDPPHFGISKDGKRRGWWEPHHRGVTLSGRSMVVSVSREVTSRVLAEQNAARLKRLYAAISATSETVIRSRTEEQLFQGVCNAAVDAGGLTAAAILFVDDAGEMLTPVAVAGVESDTLRGLEIPVSPSIDAQGMNSIAITTGEPCVSNDFLKDMRTSNWHSVAKDKKIKAAAAIPIVRGQKAIGTLFLCTDEKRAFDVETVTLLQRICENLVFGMQTREQENERQQTEERIRYLATHDSLTDLPNRHLYEELLDQAISVARRNQEKLAVMFIDLDRFKLINDSLGHAAGDILLVEMASRLRGKLRQSDVLARLGGDEFVILLHNVHSLDDVATVARKLLDAALAPLSIMDQECRVTASIGVSLFPDHGDEHSTLMKCADTAMYLAKEKGKNTVEFFETGMQTHSAENLVLEAALRNALTNGEFFLEYQAKRNLSSNQISGVEALLRWRHPDMGVVSPQRFIPLSEETGLIVPIGRWVLNEACRQNVAWQQAGSPPITVAVNLSARQFSDPNLLKDIHSALDKSGMDPRLLELELTETMVMLNPAITLDILKQLRKLGVRIALDDFGVGYSSLAQIKGFPIDTLKVDRSFIRNLPASAQDCAITQAIVNMARSLSLTVIAEGVETEAQETYLRNLSCDETQGFYFSKPTSAENFIKLLKANGKAQEKLG